jgi:uncharacterized protein involved in exopolysaccharide biosynthesis
VLSVAANEHVAVDDEDGIDLLAAWQLLWGYKYLIGGIALAAALVAVALALTATPIYRAETTVTEVRDRNMSGAASLMSQFGGLASLAGVNLGSAGATSEAQAVLKSRYLVEEFIRRNNLLPALFEKGARTPTLWRGVERFRAGVLTLREDKRNGTTTVVIDWKDPAVAARWANQFVALANEMLRNRALAEAKRNIEYLNRQMVQTNVLEIQRVMYNLIESETKTLMLANGRAEYAFTIVDPAVQPEDRISPRRTLMVIVGGVIGGFLGTVVALVHAMTRRRRLTQSTAA